MPTAVHHDVLDMQLWAQHVKERLRGETNKWGWISKQKHFTWNDDEKYQAELMKESAEKQQLSVFICMLYIAKSFREFGGKYWEHVNLLSTMQASLMTSDSLMPTYSQVCPHLWT